MAKRFVTCFIAISLSLLMLIAAAVIVFDPLYQYHLPWFGLSMPLFSERYQNAGLARQLDYDAVIIGSSMMKNNRARWFDRAFGARTLKLSFSSGYLSEYDTMLSQIYARQSLRYVFLCLDVYALSADSEYAYYPCPEYLYDESLLSDAQYLWNRDVLTDVFPQYIALQDDDTPFEDAFSFADEMPFGLGGDRLSGYRDWRAQTAPPAKLPRDAYAASCADALSAITKHIAAHPETDFYIYLPPYSALLWDTYIHKGQEEAMLGAVDEAAKILLAYDNVHLFCFLGATEITGDLSHYGDEMHFDRELSERLVSMMAAGEYAITRENRAAFMAALWDCIENYDYDALIDGA